MGPHENGDERTTARTRGRHGHAALENVSNAGAAAAATTAAATTTTTTIHCMFYISGPKRELSAATGMGVSQSAYGKTADDAMTALQLALRYHNYETYICKDETPRVEIKGHGVYNISLSQREGHFRAYTDSGQCVRSTERDND